MSGVNVNIAKLIKLLDDAIRLGSKPPDEILDLLLNVELLTPNIRALIFRASIAVMPYDKKLFILLSSRLFPSIQYILLMSKAIMFFDNWETFYRNAVRCVYEIPRYQIALGYTEISEALIFKDRNKAFENFLAGLENLALASATIRAGVSVRLSRVIIQLNINPTKYIARIIDKLVSFEDIAAISKVYSLTKIAILAKDVNKRFSRNVLNFALSQLQYVSIFRLFEAENILTNGLVEIYRENPLELVNLFSILDNRSIKPWRYAIIRLIHDGNIKPEKVIDAIAKVSREEAEKIKNYLKKKQELKNKLERILSEILF